LSPEAIKEAIARSRENLLSPLGGAVKEMILMDPLNLSLIFRKYLIPYSGMKIDLWSGYYISADRRMLLMIVKPKGSAQDIEFDRRLIKEMRRIERSVRNSFQNTSINIGYTGSYMIALRDAEIIRFDIIKNIFTSSLGVLLIFILFFHSIRKIIYPVIPFILSLLWTVSISHLILGHLSDVTGAFSALLIGLGIDLIIITYNRYLFERAEGLEPARAIEISVGKTGTGVLTGVITTLASFYSLSISRFPGIRELGLLTGTGMIFFTLAVFLVLPALIASKSDIGKRPKKVGSIGIERIALYSYRYPSLTIIIILLITSFLILNISRLRMNNDPRTLRPSGNPAIILQEKIRKKIGIMESIIVTLHADSLRDLVRLNERVEERIYYLKNGGIPILGVDSLLRFLPSEERQERNIKRVFDVERIDATIREGLKENGFRPDAFKVFRDRLKRMLTNREKITVDEIRRAGMERTLERYLREEDRIFKSVTYCYIDRNGWGKEEREEFIKTLTSIDPSIKVSGTEFIREELTGILKEDIVLITAISFILITILLYIDFRNIGFTIFCQLPLILGIIWMLGTMALLGIEFNFMNGIASALILGIGIDYAIHLLHRYLEGGGINLTIEQTGRAIVVAGLTTMVGFGSIIFSDFPGLSSMGAVTLLGVGYCLILTLALLPAVIRIYEKWDWFKE